MKLSGHIIITLPHHLIRVLTQGVIKESQAVKGWVVNHETWEMSPLAPGVLWYASPNKTLVTSDPHVSEHLTI